MVKSRWATSLCLLVGFAAMARAASVAPAVIKEVKRYRIAVIAEISRSEGDGMLPKVVLKGDVKDIAPEFLVLSDETRKAGDGRRVLILLSRDGKSDDYMLLISAGNGRITMRVDGKSVPVDLDALEKLFKEEERERGDRPSGDGG